MQVRIGINTGEVVATSTPKLGEGTVTGDPVNVAARLQQLAEPGQIIVGERTAAAAPTFETRPLGARELKGKSVETEVRELVGELAGASGRGVPGLRSPLIGRDRELELLLSIYDRVADEHRPHLVTLYGEPGVGKSRLTVEFVDALMRRDPAPTVLRGRCLSYGSGVTFWPLAEILKTLAGVLDSDSPDVVVTKAAALGSRVITGDVSPDPARTTALLGYTVGIGLPGYEFGRLEPDQLRAEIHGAWRALFSALGADRPLVVIVDDIHWADGALLDLLDDLGERVQGGALFMCPSRPELTNRRPSWGGGRRSFSSVVLDPLPADATSELVDHLLTVEDLPAPLHARIVERAGGNPFFVEEILRHLIDGGHLLRTETGWRAESGLDAVEIPDTVQAVLAARIDLLASTEKRALQAAAVVGRIFWPAPVARFLNGTSASLDDALRALESRDLVLSRLSSSMAGQAEYIFKHALVRDVAYESIPRRERADAHLVVARWIEEAIGDRRHEVIELLAHHYTEAQRAMAWAAAPADQKAEVRSRAIDLLYEAAWEAARHLAQDRARERVEIGLELALGPLERARGLEILVVLDLWTESGDTAWERAREAVDLRVAARPETSDDRRAIAAGCAQALSIPTRWPGLMRRLPTRDEAAPYLELGMSYLPDGDSEERARLLMAQGAWSWGFGEAIMDREAIEFDRQAAEQAVAMARRIGDPFLLSGALDTLGATGSLVEGYRGVLAPQWERLELVPQLDDAVELTDIYGVTTWGLTHTGEFRRAIEFGRKGVEIADAAGVFNFLAGGFMAVAQFRLGDWVDFWETFTMLNAQFDPTQALRYHSMRQYGVAAYIREVTGDSDEADRLIERLDQSQVELGAVGVSGARCWIVAILARRGRFAEARDRLGVADPVRDIQNRDLDYEGWADLIAAEGTWDQAPAVISEARKWAEDTGLKFLPFIAERLEGRAALAGGDLAAAARILQRARDGFDGLGAVWERARTDVALAEALLAAGRSSDAAAAANNAKEVFERLGAEADRKRVAGMVPVV
jgi:hypothetical protein